jgi:hypothetical protein
VLAQKAGREPDDIDDHERYRQRAYIYNELKNLVVRARGGIEARDEGDAIARVVVYFTRDPLHLFSTPDDNGRLFRRRK